MAIDNILKVRSSPILPGMGPIQSLLGRGSSKVEASLYKPFFKAGFAQNLVYCSEGNMRSMLVPELQSHHAPVSLRNAGQSSALSWAKNNWPTGLWGIGNRISVIYPKEELIYREPRTVDQSFNH